MLLVAIGVLAKSSTHQPEAEYRRADGKTGRRKKSWEIEVEFDDEIWSRAKAATVKVRKTALLESRVDLRPGKYDLRMRPRLRFGEIDFQIVGIESAAPTEKQK